MIIYRVVTHLNYGLFLPLAGSRNSGSSGAVNRAAYFGERSVNGERFLVYTTHADSNTDMNFAGIAKEEKNREGPSFAGVILCNQQKNGTVHELTLRLSELKDKADSLEGLGRQITAARKIFQVDDEGSPKVPDEIVDLFEGEAPTWQKVQP